MPLAHLEPGIHVARNEISDIPLANKDSSSLQMPREEEIDEKERQDLPIIRLWKGERSRSGRARVPITEKIKQHTDLSRPQQHKLAVTHSSDQSSSNIHRLQTKPQL